MDFWSKYCGEINIFGADMRNWASRIFDRLETVEISIVFDDLPKSMKIKKESRIIKKDLMEIYEKLTRSTKNIENVSKYNFPSHSSIFVILRWAWLNVRSA